MLGRPMRRLFLAQCRRKPSRCHRTTVSGFKATSIFRQPLTKRAKTIQKKRSPRVGQIRFERDFIIASCCRRARFSKASSCRDRQHDLSHRTSKVAHISMRRMLQSGTRKVKYFNAIEFTGWTGLVTAWAMDPNEIVMSERAEKVCHREIENRTPLGHREIKTSSYRLDGSYIGVARGRLKTQASPNKWTAVNWMCRVNQKSGSILRVEFGRSTSGSKLLAAASAF